MENIKDAHHSSPTSSSVESEEEFYHGKAPKIEIEESEHVPLAGLCDSCCEIFSEHRENFGDYNLKQTYADFRSAVEAQSCSLCCLRWSQLSTTERDERWTAMSFSLYSHGPDNAIGITFYYTKGDGGPGNYCFHPVVLVPVSEHTSCVDHATHFESTPAITHEPESTGSRVSLARAYSWYRGCIEEHLSCKQDIPAVRSLPTRLIYLGQGVETTPALVESKDLPSGVDYMTVSHCWGQHRITCLTHENIQEMKTRVPASAISKSFREAMDVAKQFGVLYVWIDSLCIIQKDLGDWQKESLRMADVYRNAACNIAATSAEDGRAGCFSTRSRSAVLPCKVNVTWRELAWRKHYILDANLWHKNITNSPLGRRAWVVQERYLARRMIHFAQDQLFWECREQKACEAFPEKLPSVIETRIVISGQPQTSHVVSLKNAWGSPEVSAKKAQEVWSGLVEEYSNGNLTEERDKLVAIAGLAKAIAPHMNCRYLAGLWEYDLPLQLLWSVTFAEAKRIKTYQAPTWSWASLEGKVRLDPVFSKVREESDSYVALEIIDAEVTHLTDDAMGQVKSGFLRISGCLAKATVQRDRTDGFFKLMKHHPSNADEKIVRIFQSDTPDLQSGQSVYCLPVDVSDTNISGLVLKPLKRNEQSNEVCFERLGTFRTYDSFTGYERPGSYLEDCQRFWEQCMEFPKQQRPEDLFYMEERAEFYEDGFSRYVFIME